jgi:hypothetical protein
MKIQYTKACSKAGQIEHVKSLVGEVLIASGFAEEVNGEKFTMADYIGPIGYEMKCASKTWDEIDYILFPDTRINDSKHLTTGHGSKSRPIVLKWCKLRGLELPDQK